MFARRSIRLTGKWKGYIVIIFVLAFFLIADSGPLAENTRPRVLRSRAYRLKNILNKDVKHQLESLDIGTKIDLLPKNAMIVTAADMADLIAASSVIRLIDCEQRYVIKVLADYSESDILPTTQQIADFIGIAGVGSFAEPPAADAADRIIVDVRDSKVIAVVPVLLLDRVSAAVSELMAAAKADKTELADEPAESKGKTQAPRSTEAAVQPQASQVADVESEATIGDVIDEFLVTDYPAKETPEVKDVSPETAVGNKPETHGFFQAEMFESLAETETNAKSFQGEIAQAEMFESLAKTEANAKSIWREIAQAERKTNEALIQAIKADELAREKERLAAEAKAKASLDKIVEAERKANEAVARAIKAEELAREKGHLAAEAIRRATEAERRAAEAQMAVLPDQPVKKKTPVQPDVAAQKPKTQPKTEVASKTEPKAAAKTEDKTQPAVDPKASTETKSTVSPPDADDKMLEMLKKLTALAVKGAAERKEAEIAKGKTETAVAEERIPPIPPVPPVPKTATKTTPPVRPVPKPTTPRIPPGAGKTDKIATETPSKVASAIPNAEAELLTVMTLPEKVKISALIELVGKQLKINYMYDITDAKLINSEVFLKLHDGRIKVKDMYMLLESVLKSKGYAMMRRGNLVTVTKSAAALDLDPEIREGVGDGQLGRMIVTTVFKLEHISTATAAAMLKNMKLGLLFNAIEETKTLMVTGYAYRMARMEEVLNMIDVPGKERIFRSRKLEYLSPSELATKVKALAQQLGTISITVSARPSAPTRLPTKRPTPTRRPTPTTRVPVRVPAAVAGKGVYLDTDDRTNRVLMIGLEEDMEIVDMLIDSLDVAKYGLRSVKEYTMQYVEATEILSTLAELNVIGSIPQISVRLTTNSLLVNATPEQHAEIEMMIRFVDVEQKDSRKSIKEYTMQYVEATEILNTLAELGVFGSKSGSARTSRSPTPPRLPTPPRPPTKGAPPTTRPPTTYGTQTVQGGPQISVRLTTNSLIVNATPEQHAEIAMLIRFVDVEQKDGLRSVKEYAMQYVEATEILNTLAELGVIGSISGSAKTSRSPTLLRTPTKGAPTARRPTSYGTQAVQSGPQISVRLATNSLLVNGTPEQHAKIEMLIRFIDVEQKDIRTVQEYEIQYVDITEIVDTLAELGIVEQRTSSRQSGGSRTTTETRTPTAGAAAPATTTTTFEATTGTEITTEQPQIAVLESTNSLLVYATPKQHDTIALIVAHVDRELTEISTPYVVYALENQDPEELAATLNEIIQATVRDAARSATSKITTKDPAAAGIPPKREKNEIQIVADVMSYSLIVYADRKNQQWISALIDELDAYRPQVHLEVTLVEISKDDLFNYDLELVSKLPNMAGGGVMESGLVTALVDPFLSGNIFEGSSKDGSGIAFFSDKHIQTLLDFVDRKNYGRILARPSLLVKDNQLGEIRAEKTIYVAQEKSSIVPTNTNSSSTVTDVTFLPYTSGVTLSITPHISSDKILQLEIILDRTDFILGTDTASIRGETFPKPLDTVSSNVATWAVLPNGATIILGGIESITQAKTIQKVPILGDIPILGALFRGIDETDKQSKLYVFVKATIIMPGDELTGVSDIEVISRKKREAFEKHEARFQKLEGVIPGVTPPPLDPVKILEDDEYILELKKRLHKDEKASVKVKLDDAY